MNEPTALEPTALEPTATRLREAPTTRFSGPQHAFDLLQMSAHLLNETHVGANGHRQMTIFHRDATTMVLFAFEAGGTLANHKANGLVTIHALDGAFTIEAQSEDGWQSHELRASQLLVLSPGVVHNVTAPKASRMLLTVQLEKGIAALPGIDCQHRLPGIDSHLHVRVEDFGLRFVA
jgi:quercetin dioxygenase-like cupin family protein